MLAKTLTILLIKEPKPKFKMRKVEVVHLQVKA